MKVGGYMFVSPFPVHVALYSYCILGFWLNSGLQKVLSYKRATCAEGKDWEKLESVLARQLLFLNWQKLPTSHGGPVLL